MIMKKILVSIKRVPDYATKVKIASGDQSIVQDGIKWIMNPFDEIAVEEAVRIKEKDTAIEVVVVSIGPAGTTEQLRTALAIGADRAIHVLTDAALDSDGASRVLQKIFEKETPDLVLMGKQSIDSDANQSGQLLAERLHLPQATFASKIVIDGTDSLVTREVDGGLETLRISLPAIVTTDLRLNEPRYPSLPGIVKAKKKPLEEISLDSLGVDIAAKVKITKLSYPAARKGGVKVSSVDELIQKLQNEAKVL
jgi:electron transfer flavoprotein beta subunit